METRFVETADLAPNFFAVGVEENKCRRKFKAIDGREFLPDFFLNVKTDEFDASCVLGFEPVNDRL